MSARVFDIQDWQAARQRRADRERAVLRALYAGPPQPNRLTLDDILGPAFDPKGGTA
jgi:hypothetical protein